MFSYILAASWTEEELVLLHNLYNLLIIKKKKATDKPTCEWRRRSCCLKCHRLRLFCSGSTTAAATCSIHFPHRQYWLEHPFISFKTIESFNYGSTSPHLRTYDMTRANMYYYILRGCMDGCWLTLVFLTNISLVNLNLAKSDLDFRLA